MRPLGWCLLSLGLFAAMAFPGIGHTQARKSFTGYVRPGWPSDGPEGRVIFAGETGAPTISLGGSIYFKVYERTDTDPDDPYGLGVDLRTEFKPGVHFTGSASPHVKDIHPEYAKYLYLYQVVNDRKPPKEAWTQSNIESVSVRIHVPLEGISSWGVIDGASFAVERKAEKDEKAVIRPVSYAGPDWDGEDKGSARFAFFDPAPSHPILRPFLVRKLVAAKKLGNVEKGVAVLWETLDPPVAPDFVMLLAPAEGNKEELPSFRAIWGNKSLGKNNRSTVFGFTSPYPPMYDKLGGILRSPAKQAERNPIKPAVSSKLDLLEFVFQAEEEAGKVIEAAGEVPTPKAEGGGPGGRAPGMPPAGPGSGASLLSSITTSTSGGGGGGAISPAGFGAARAFASGGGSGSGSGSGSTDQGQDQNQRERINVNVTQNNNQSQSQKQKQRQDQEQEQSQNNKPGSTPPVIPAPPAFLLALLGLPALFLVNRKRKRLDSEPI